MEKIGGIDRAESWVEEGCIWGGRKGIVRVKKEVEGVEGSKYEQVCRAVVGRGKGAAVTTNNKGGQGESQGVKS